MGNGSQKVVRRSYEHHQKALQMGYQSTYIQHS
jgi:hypothetical protein